MSKKKQIKHSSKKKFNGSVEQGFYDEGYYLHGEGSNYGSGDFIPYDERYLTRDRATVDVFNNSISNLSSAIVLGCARGYMIQAFHERGIDAVGVDISEWAVKNSPEAYRDKIYCGDICDLSKWKDKEFTLAVGLDVFEHIKVPDLYKAISEACRVAEWVIINLPINPDDETPDMTSGQDKSHISVYSKTWWITQFMACGHEPVDVQEYVDPKPSPGSKWMDKRDHNLTIYFRRADANQEANKYVKTIPRPVIKDGGKQFKILWWSNGSHCQTGYGVGTKHVIYPLNEYYDVASLAYWGLEGAAINMNGVKVFPKMYDQFGIDAADLICRNWKPDIMITLFDIWIGDSPLYNGERDWFSKIHPRHIAYFPVDHEPIPVPTLNQAKLAYHCVAMSKFGHNQLRKAGINSSYIPHGVDTKTYEPVEDRSKSREWLMNIAGVPLFSNMEVEPWDNDSFIIGKVAANKDTTRKGFDREMAGFKIFLEQNPDAKKDARIYWHTDPRFPGGYHLDHYAHLMGIDKYIKKTHPFYIYGGVSEVNMAKMYQSFDILTSFSRNEGFGIPIIEAQSCGVPVGVTDSTSMPELVLGHGWVTKPKTWEPTALLSNQFIPDEWEIAKVYSEAYNSPDKVKEYGVASRDFAEQYDWDNVITPLWLNLIEKLRQGIEGDKDDVAGKRLI